MGDEQTPWERRAGVSDAFLAGLQAGGTQGRVRELPRVHAQVRFARAELEPLCAQHC